MEFHILHLGLMNPGVQVFPIRVHAAVETDFLFLIGIR